MFNVFSLRKKGAKSFSTNSVLKALLMQTLKFLADFFAPRSHSGRGEVKTAPASCPRKQPSRYELIKSC
jgi:hypothetical protein